MVGNWLVVEHEYLHCSVCGEEMWTGCSTTKEAKELSKHWKPFCPECGSPMETDRKRKERIQ